MIDAECVLQSRSREISMLALVVKPSLHGRLKFNKVLSELEKFQPVILMANSREGLTKEISDLWRTNPNLTVVACGGDGTFNLALNAIPSLEIPLAVIPMGTGNDFARYLSIKSVGHGISVLSSCGPVKMDMGTIELSDNSAFRFAGIASCGFDAQVNERANTYRGPSGTLKYLVALAAELVYLKSRKLCLTIDSKLTKTEEYTLIAVGNTSSYGGGLRMCPTANAYDEQFEITCVDKVSRRLLVRVLPKVFWGGHTKHKQVEQKSAQLVQISGEEFPVYADGEKVGHGPVVIRMHPAAMRVWQAQPSDTL